ncbi:DNA polymerase I [Desulfovibrio desulfuricans]|uniref:DNA polymerase I n=1 Tax=Desulfovibrio desulfuricans TaxID=876 RepID=UPI001AE5A304|nr:DNA polymerase I [Desulfovibrio desulfuricans]QTO39344.1 DNA polymerase I [Desulfovibrio desulfuricans]
MSLKQRLNLSAEPVFLMDGSAFIYRGFFANKNMQRSDGFPTNALVVVTRVLLRILRDERPAHFLFVKDGKGKNFRHDLYPLYKANRDATPEDLVRQMDPIVRMVKALGIPVEISDGCEADDCIASLAARFSVQRPVVIVSGDKDLKQCLGPNVYMWDPAFKEEKLLSAAEFTAESGLRPDQWADVQALVGDTSDNIPGVPGIGPKTAQKIFEICPTLEDIRDHFALLGPKIQDKLRDHLENMFLWRQLTSLSLDVCTGLTLDDMTVNPLDEAQCASMADEFELHALRRDMATLARLQRSAPPGSAAAPAESASNAGSNTGADVAASRSAAQGSLMAPAEKSPSKTRPAAGAGPQMSLLDVADEPEAPLLSEAGQLPLCAGLEAAIIWPGGPSKPPHVAVAGGDDFRWGGTVDDLCTWLAGAQRLVTSDLKAQLIAAACWRKLPSEANPPFFFDLGLAAYLINPEESDYGWPRLAVRWGIPLHEGQGGNGPACMALRMAASMEQRLEADGLLDLYRTLELPLTPVLAQMEARGVAIDAAAFQSFLSDVQGEIDRLTQEVFAAAGTTFNIRSAQQLGEVLFNMLKLPSPRKTRGGQASTNQETLEKLAGQHPVVESILQFRKLEKMRSTYLDPLPRLVDPRGRIHTTFNQKATATGRLSSSNPNLQNIPVRGPLGKRMRSCFIAGPDHALVSADYSQVELRVLAHMSQDTALLEAFRNGEDIHARTAALVYDLPSSEVSPDQRRNAKTINFGLIYGMGAQKLAQELKITTNEAKEFIARYFERLTGLKQFYEEVEAVAKRQGYVTTLGGRRRLLPDIHSANGQNYALARRQAINTVIQGSAADIIKLAMLAVAHDAELKRLDARLLLQVHDELLLEVPTEAAAAAGERVAALMGGVAPGGVALSVPLVVDWGQGRDWGSAH